MKEYSFVDFANFKKGRLEFFKTYGKKISTFLPARAVWNLEQAYATLSVWKPCIAVYPGSFNPFHHGHLRILQKADRMFDKVIVARGFNPEKAGAKVFDLPQEILNNYQVDTYFGLLTDYLKTKEYPVTVIRGLRSGMDLHAEITQYRYLQDLMPEIDLVNIFTDTDVEHISSSGIKSLHPYMDKTPYEL
jgi:pantetheine-phosphate adenylyltransferase